MVKQMFSVFMMAIFIMSMPSIVHADFADEIKLIADDSANGDDFGESVSISGNTAIVGARSNDSNGSAYIFVRDSVNNTWTQQQKLRAADGAFQDNFGVSVSISGDTAIIGAGMDDDAGTSTGSAYVFVRNPSTKIWTLQQKLLASDGAAYDYFGRTVAISGDRVIVGSPWPTGITSSTGYAYIFVRDPATGVWTEQEKLAPSDGVVNDYFGQKVAIDGETALVGAGVLGATTYTYKYNSATGNWDESKLILANTSVYVGNYVSIRGDIAITGAPYITSYGSAYIFVRNTITGEWAEEQRLLQPDATSWNNFGYSVAIDSDLAVVGAYNNGEPVLYAGAAYAFVRDPSTGIWTPQKLLASDGGAFYQFGYSVSNDGDTIIVGANGANGVEANTGAAYIYTYTATVLPASDITVTDSVVPATDLVVAFGDVAELASADQTVTITNDGNADLTLGNIPDADALAAPFTIETDTCSGQVLTPATNCMLTVRFSPTSTGIFSDSFDIPSDDPDENLVTVNVNGTGIGITVPDISITDIVAPIDDLVVTFGNVTELTTSDQTVTINNVGNADLVMGNLAMVDTLAAPFSILSDNDNCSSQTLVAAASCTVTVRFAPVTTGAFNDSFDIPSNDSDEASVTFNLSGTGISTPVADITVTDQVAPVNDLQIPFTDLTVAGSSDQTVTITNEGNADLVIGNVAQTNVLAAPFSVINDNCSGQTLATTASCTLVVHFAPPVAGIFNDSFDIPSNDPDESTVTVNVSATGLAAGVNNPPSSPGLVSPVNGRQGLGTSVLLLWNPATDPDGDAVRYEVYNCTDNDPLNNCSPLTEVASLDQEQDTGFSYAGLGLGSGFVLLGITFAGGIRNRRQTVLLLAAIVLSFLLASCGDNNYKSYRVSGLDADTTYYWAIVAKDGNGGETPSAVWRYNTQ